MSIQERSTTASVTTAIRPTGAERDPLRTARRRRLQERLLAWVTPIVVLGAWEIAARTGAIPVRFFPAPSMIFGTGVDMVRAGTLQKDLLATMTRVLIGFTAGSVVGAAAGLLLGLSRLAKAALDPFLSALYTVPKLSLLPLLLLIFGLGETPMILLVALSVFFPTWITCMAAVTAIPEGYQEAARAFGAGRWAKFRHVIWPAFLPNLFVALRLSIGVAILVIVGAEFVQGNSGIGYRIWHSWSLFQARPMYVGICVIALMGLICSMIVSAVGRKLLPWAPQQQKH